MSAQWILYERIDFSDVTNEYHGQWESVKYSENAGAGSDPDAIHDEALITITEQDIAYKI